MTPDQKIEALERELAFVRREYQEYLSAISHDFAAPLRRMSSFSEIILMQNEAAFDDETKTLFDFIIAGAAEGKTMLQDLAKFSRLDQNSPKFEPYDSQGLVESVLTSLSDLSESPDIDIRLGKLPVLNGDPDQMHQAFYHLLKNALLYRDRNQNTTITVTALDHDDTVEFRVSDNGIGVPENMDDSVFDILTRGVRQDEYPGKGMGLSIARKIIHRHGGTIELLRNAPMKTVMRFTVSKNPAANLNFYDQ